MILAPLRVEAWALGATRTGMGVREVELGEARRVAVGGLCGAVDPALRPGDVVVASEVRAGGEALACSTEVAGGLERGGLRVRVGPVVSLDHVAGPAERALIADAIAVDMESYWLVRTAGGREVAVVRAVVDRAGRRLADPRTIPAGIRGLRALRRAAPVLHRWAEVQSQV